MSLTTMSLATMFLAIIVPRDKFYNRLKQKKYNNSNKRFALFTSSSYTDYIAHTVFAAILG